MTSLTIAVSTSSCTSTPARPRTDPRTQTRTNASGRGKPQDLHRVGEHHIAEPRLCQQPVERLGVPQTKRGVQDCSHRRPHVMGQPLRKRGMSWVVVQCPPDDKGHASARPQHAMHLPQGREAVGKELHPLLADHHVECRGGEGEGGCTALHPHPCWCLRAGDRQHPPMEVETDDHASGSRVVSSHARHNAGAAGDIQHTAARLQGQQGQEVCRPQGEGGGDHIPLIDLCDGGRRLPCSW